LNPYQKNSGTCLPLEDSSASSVTKTSGVEEGGLSWPRKFCQRIKEQAEKENRNFKDVATEKYG
jgi:hypothetical protein